jgi:hypothetical protein
VRAFQETIFVQRESWIRLLTQPTAGTSLAVVVPIPLDGSAAMTVRTPLGEAIEPQRPDRLGALQAELHYVRVRRGVARDVDVACVLIDSDVTREAYPHRPAHLRGLLAEHLEMIG